MGALRSTAAQDGGARAVPKLWMWRGRGESDQKVIDYEGRTWRNDEDDGLYFKMGCYTGEPG